MGNFVSAENAKKYFFSNAYYQKKRREGGQGRFVQRGQIFEVLRTWEIHSSVSSYIAKFQECGEGPPIFFFDLLDFGEDWGAGEEGFLVFSSRPTSH